MRTRLCAPVALLGLLLLGTPSHANPNDPTRENVIEAVRTGYVHGVTAEIAHARVGVAGVDELLSLLADPDFDARDNVVAFLHHLGDDSSVEALLQQLQQPIGDRFQPANDRALLLIPQTLGGIAGRRNPRALAVLLEMTSEASEGGAFRRSTTRPHADPSIHDMLEMAMRGLAYAQDPVALGRLNALRDRRVRPTSRGNLETQASKALELYEELAADTVSAPEADSPAATSMTDPTTYIKEHNVKFTNHIDHPNPMTKERAEDLAFHATTKLSTSSYPKDTACCIRIIRKLGNVNSTFGEEGDGLDIIGTAKEMDKVLEASPRRFKVVRLINYCNGPVQNAWGCGKINGNGIAVVRRTNLHQEAMLWAHEFGHNRGLDHDELDPRALMFPGISTNTDHNLGLSAAECSVFHSQGQMAELCNGVGCF